MAVYDLDQIAHHLAANAGYQTLTDLIASRQRIWRGRAHPPAPGFLRRHRAVATGYDKLAPAVC